MANLPFTSHRRFAPIALGILALLVVIFLINAGYWLQQAKYFLGLTEESDALSSVRLEPNMIVIPRLNIKAPIVFTDSRDEKTFQEQLKNGVVHYPDTAAIGEKGNPYIFGHSSNYPWIKSNYNSIFALLPKIEIGDLIYASNGHGKTFTYSVIETHIASPKDTQYLDQHNYQEKLLTVQTSYPVGTVLKRFIVIAKIQK